MSQGLLTDEELESALTHQESNSVPLGEIVVDRGWVSRPALLRALATQRDRELEFERGFGSGLFALLDQRHELRRSLEIDAASNAA